VGFCTPKGKRPIALGQDPFTFLGLAIPAATRVVRMAMVEAETA